MTTVLTVLVEVTVASPVTDEHRKWYAKRVFEGIRREWEEVGFSNEDAPVEALDVTCGPVTYSVDGGKL